MNLLYLLSLVLLILKLSGVLALGWFFVFLPVLILWSLRVLMIVFGALAVASIATHRRY